MRAIKDCCSQMDLELSLYLLNYIGVLFNFLALISFAVHDLIVNLGLLVLVIVGERVVQILYYLHQENQFAFVDNIDDKNKELLMRICYSDAYLHFTDRQKARSSKSDELQAQQKRRKVALIVQQIFGSVGACGGLFIESHGLILSGKSDPILCICIAIHLVSLSLANTSVYLKDDYKNISFKFLIFKNFLNLLAFFGFWSLCADIQRPKFIAPHLVAAGILLLILFFLFREKDKSQENVSVIVGKNKIANPKAVDQIIPNMNSPEQLEKLILHDKNSNSKAAQGRRGSLKNQVNQQQLIANGGITKDRNKNNNIKPNNDNMDIDQSNFQLKKKDLDIENPTLAPSQKEFLQNDNTPNNALAIRFLQEQQQQQQDYALASLDAASEVKVIQAQDKTDNSQWAQNEQEQVMNQKYIEAENTEEEKSSTHQLDHEKEHNQREHPNEGTTQNTKNLKNSSFDNDTPSVKNTTTFKTTELSKLADQPIAVEEISVIGGNIPEEPAVTNRNPSPMLGYKSERMPSLRGQLNETDIQNKQNDYIESSEEFDAVPEIIIKKKKSQLDILAEDCYLLIKFIICGLLLNHNYTGKVLFDSYWSHNDGDVMNNSRNTSNNNNKTKEDYNLSLSKSTDWSLTKPLSAFKAANIFFLFIFDVAFNEFSYFSGLRVLSIITGVCYFFIEVGFLIDFDPKNNFCYEFAAKYYQQKQRPPQGTARP